MHALIFVFVSERPFVGVSYDPKIERLLETLGERHAGTLLDLSVEGLIDKILQVKNDTLSMKRRQERVAELRSQALCNAACAMNLLVEKGEKVFMSNRNKVKL